MSSWTARLVWMLARIVSGIVLDEVMDVVQLLIVAVACAIVPNVLVRGQITLVTHRLYRSHAGRAGACSGCGKSSVMPNCAH